MSSKRLHDRSRRYHDRVARQYDSIYDDPYWEFHDELTWRMIKPHLPRDTSARCADLGCGTGKWGLKLLKSGFATTFVDSSAAMIEQIVERGNLDALEEFVRGSRTNWLTADEQERFELTTFTPASLTKLFERSGFEVMGVSGKTIVPVRSNKKLLEYPNAVERLLRLESDLAKDPSAAARAGHLQIVARRLVPSPSGSGLG